MNKKTNKTASDNDEVPSRTEGSGKGILKLGLDVHYRQVSVAMQEGEGRIKAVGKMSHAAFGNWVEKKLKAGFDKPLRDNLALLMLTRMGSRRTTGPAAPQPHFGYK